LFQVDVESVQYSREGVGSDGGLQKEERAPAWLMRGRDLEIVVGLLRYAVLYKGLTLLLHPLHFFPPKLCRREYSSELLQKKYRHFLASFRPIFFFAQ